jgi:pilus assembly protein CpaB
MARKLILVVFALVIAGSTVWFVRNWAGNRPSIALAPEVVQQMAVAPKASKKILVAAADLPAGTLVREEHIRWQQWPEVENLEEQYVVENARPLDEFYGTVVRQGISAGEPIFDKRLVKPGEQGFLAAVLKPGTRAISIEVDATSGVAGFVFPGDRIDVVLTLEVRQSNTEEALPHFASETILTNVRVVAMDQSTNDQEQEATVRRIATLEVSPKEVEVVSVSKELGRLSLSLRSIARADDKEGNMEDDSRGRGFTWDSEASALINKPPQKSRGADSVVVVRAGQTKEQTFD